MNSLAPAWMWGVGMVICYALALLIHPRRKQFIQAYGFTRRHPKAFLLVGVANAYPYWLAARDALTPAVWPEDFLPASPDTTSGEAATGAVGSLVKALFCPISPALLSGLFGLALLFNYLGVRATFQRGCHVTFGKGLLAGTVFWVTLVAAVLQVAALVLDFIAIDIGIWGKVVSGGGALFASATVVCVLGWLMRYMEAYCRAPEQILETRWVAAASGRFARLWPIVAIIAGWSLGGIWWSFSLPTWLFITLCALACCGAFLPFLLLHWRGSWGWRRALHTGRMRSMRHFHELVGWIVIAWLHFFLFHLADIGMAQAFDPGGALLLGWRTLAAFIHAALTVWMLAAWTAIQCLLFPQEEAERTNGLPS